MQSTNRPGKFLVPFAQNDSARVELPATTADATRASQSLGFPPATGLPPEAGGVPPQLEDMNGGLNQISRGVWWALGGGRYPFDSTWANDALIGGYARGAVVPAALGAGQIGLGDWYNNTEANTANPDTDGTGWVPGYQYGATALTGQTGGTVTLTPAQAAKRVITIAGTLTSNLVLVVPTWVYDWTIYNNTGGAFTVTVKNAATPGAVIPQNGAPTPIRCDGTAVTAWSPNIAPATSATQPLQLGQAVGRLLNVQRFTAAGTYTPTAGTTRIIVEIVGGGGGGGGAQSSSNAASFGTGGGAGAYAKALFNSFPATVAVTIGTGGTGGTGVAGTFGGAGGTSTFGTLVSAPGGGGGRSLAADPTVLTNFGSEGGTGGTGATTTGATLVLADGSSGGPGAALGTSGSQFLSAGIGGPSVFGGTAKTANTPSGASARANTGAGGSGTTAASGAATTNVGGSGGSGLCIVWEYA